jgi:HSP20 family molecular chaperone IbpA
MNMLVIEHEYASLKEARPFLQEPTLFPCAEDLTSSPPALDRPSEIEDEIAVLVEPEPEPEAAKPSIPPLQAKRPMDVATTPQGLEIRLEAPGLREQDFEIEVCGEMLTIKGECRQDHGGAGRVYRVTERQYGPFTRAIDLPGSVPAEGITASLDRGVLTILIPNPLGPRTTRVQVQSAPALLTETEHALEFAMAAPGLQEDDLKVEVLGRRLTVRGAHGRGVAGGEGAAGDAPAGEGALLRIVDLPEDVRAEQITAELSRGVLKVTIPNRTEVGPQRVRVQAA